MSSLPLFDDVRLELLPGDLDGLTGVPADVALTVACRPKGGLVAVLDTLAALHAQGHQAVPHLPARAFATVDDLSRLLARLEELEVKEAFVIGGDEGYAGGPYPDAQALIAALRDRGARLRLGVAGYPEGHPQIDAERLWAALATKRQEADYLVSQICFDAERLAAWLAEARGRGVELPLYVGLPGALERSRLLRVGRLIGVGASLGFLRRQPALWRLAREPRFEPSPLVAQIAEALKERGVAAAGLQLSAFGNVVETTRWLAGVRAGGAPDERG